VTPSKTPTNFKKIKVEDLVEVEDLVKEELNITNDEVLPKLNMAITLREQSFYDQALERYSQILEQDPNHSRSLYGVALTLKRQKDYAEALKIAQPLKERLDNEKDEESLYPDVVELLATLHVQLDQFDEAMREFRIMMKHRNEPFGHIYLFIKDLRKKDRSDEIVEILELLRDEMSTSGMSLLVTMFLSYTGVDALFEACNWALDKADKLNIAKETYQVAIAAAEDKTTFAQNLVGLRYWYGKTLFEYCHDEDSEKEAISVYEQNFTFAIDQSNDWIHYICSFHTVRVSSHIARITFN